MELLQDTIQRFRKAFACEPRFLVTAPGRVNLLGDHTDYNDGFVLPIAIDKKIIAAIGPRSDEEIHIHSVDYLDTYSTALDELHFDRLKHWANYPIGVINIIRETGARLGGLNLCFRGTIPIGSGLSSSAAVEIACLVAVTRLFGIEISASDSIRLAQRAEAEFVGVNCGIMDQFVSVMGKRNHAVFLDCRSLHYEYIPFPFAYRIIVCDTGIRHELALSEYNQRRNECVVAVAHFRRVDPSITALRDVSLELFQQEQANLHPVIRKRAHHVITENARVGQGISALQRGEMSLFGKLMIDSHISLRDQYEVSCKELDTVVDSAVEAEGVLGARMTGAGFGGCAICLVAEDSVDNAVDVIHTEYTAKRGSTPTITVVKLEEGALIYDLRKAGLPVRVTD